MSEENKKTNFFKQAFKSVKDLDKYEDFAAEQPKVAFKYLLKMVLIFTVIIAAFYTYKIVDSLNNIYSDLKSIVPEFSYSNGELTVNGEQPIILKQLEESVGKLIIDTNITDNATQQYEEEIKESAATVLVLKDKIIMTSNDAAGQVLYNYSDIIDTYGITEFTKQDVINYIDGMNVISIYSSIYSSIYLIIFIYLFIVYFMSTLIDVLILTVLTFIVSRISRIRLKFAPSFNIAVHGITLPVLLNLIYIIVNLLTGFTIKYFQFMYTTISYIYVIVAILMIKTDFINRQIELIKIAGEQEKVREELKKQKEEKEKKKEEENKEKEPKENNGKKEKQKEDDGELEGGVNPSVIQEKQ